MLTQLLPKRFQLAKTFALTILFFAFIVRFSLYFLTLNTIDFSFVNLFKILTIGAFYDLGVLSYVFLLYTIYLLLTPKKLHGSKFDRIVTKFTYGLLLFVFIFSFLAEIPFWQEYQRRYNFIAVDYLLYTYEVVENIHQSFPIPLLVGVIILILVISIKYAKKVNAYKYTFESNEPFSKKLIPAFFSILAFSFFHFKVKNTNAEIFNNINENELAKSGMFSFFAAYKSNELNYKEFYDTIPQKEVYTILRKNVKAQNDSLINNEGIKRITVNNTGKEKKPNIIFIGLESLNARFMTTFGNKHTWTPTLDSLVEKSIFFNNLYATGTRTIRGIEAISLSIPPTPGRSIVKRENNENLFTIGEVFKQKGYSRSFIYGGDGHFDNMTNYFSNNGFDIVDRRKLHRLKKNLPTKRTRIEDEETTFENAWAICDGDLFNKVLKVADEQHKKQQPFFNFIMTSSNHKPYTYPENIIDIPSGKDIKGSMKYLDESLRRFLEEAKTKPWFENTVFVIMSDHCAFSAGRTEINVENHHIPAFIFNLKENKPSIINKLSSQIDIFPTLFGYLNWSYTSNLYGRDINKMKPEDERAFIGNHRKVGLLKPGKLLLLETQRGHVFYDWNQSKNEIIPTETDPIILKETISYYQAAYEMFKNEKLKLN
ncbi:LTA synthase family protein [Tenacibaculum sp. nBUS_03]|uniref:LTA synthase family protein n=1 Tax=Tenacibaculum sp. nBUS_03 TaxID=3395320 RepID=UPI003EBE0D83